MISSYFCDFTQEDSPEFHSIVNAGILEKIPSISSDVVLAIKHHHENNDGSGPLGIKNSSIHPISKFIRLADEVSFFGGLSKDEFNDKLDLLKGKIDLSLLRSIRK